MRIRLISVIGGSHCTDAERALAEQVGSLLAQKGIGVVCGGRGGVMEAVCRGAAAEGGLTIGILPGESPSDGNAYVSVALPTGMGEARNIMVVRVGEGIIAIGGGLGTLSEIAHALRLGKPVVALGSWRAVSPQGEELPIRRAETAEEAVALVSESRG